VKRDYMSDCIETYVKEFFETEFHGETPYNETTKFTDMPLHRDTILELMMMAQSQFEVNIGGYAAEDELYATGTPADLIAKLKSGDGRRELSPRDTALNRALSLT
jgi:hypothetical protein